jgi:hypothetical protein
MKISLALISVVYTIYYVVNIIPLSPFDFGRENPD